ncbi:hypothetical protein KQX54_015702 [Cotesia glomerata]|uniref:Uncharacterized protein n=1 Tax=Cotesia glomerata TaxID=32391 RepID=A0AAV7HUD5_COTGL|nr:hypothetical protein KQX54_015702 [Cotesia glomerata]
MAFASLYVTLEFLEPLSWTPGSLLLFAAQPLLFLYWASDQTIPYGPVHHGLELEGAFFAGSLAPASGILMCLFFSQYRSYAPPQLNRKIKKNWMVDGKW